MSLVDYLHDNRTPMELAKELARTAHENAALRDKLGAAEMELFWMKVAEREPVAQASAAPDALDAARYRWIRDTENNGYHLNGPTGVGKFHTSQKTRDGEGLYYFGDSLDKAIDAARLAATESNKEE